MVTGDPVAEERIEEFLTRLRHVTPELTGADLIALGYRPGRPLGAALKALLQARLDGCVQSREEEVALARKLLSE